MFLTKASKFVGGADADIVAGNTLVEIKTTKNSAMQARDLDQLLGYLFLARHYQHDEPSFPSIERLAIYFARHGKFWHVDSAEWTQNPKFIDNERWFIERASARREIAKNRFMNTFLKSRHQD